jgi:NAD(P)-dependent dehydrogenase (short-subunit alcohol dehydrogenase family)
MQSVVLVSGGARGLGKEVARRLAASGHHVVIGARDAGQAAVAAEEVGAAALPVALDVADDTSVRASADALVATPGRLDVLVNNAAAFPDFAGTVTSANLDAVRRVLETNLIGRLAAHPSRAPVAAPQPGAPDVNVSSGAGSHGDTTYGLTSRHGTTASYAISKAALNALTSILAAELAGSGILVNAVCPLQQADVPAGVGQHRGRDHAVMPAADDDRVDSEHAHRAPSS